MARSRGNSRSQTIHLSCGQCRLHNENSGQRRERQRQRSPETDSSSDVPLTTGLVINSKKDGHNEILLCRFTPAIPASSVILVQHSQAKLILCYDDRVNISFAQKDTSINNGRQLLRDLRSSLHFIHELKVRSDADPDEPSNGRLDGDDEVRHLIKKTCPNARHLHATIASANIMESIINDEEAATPVQHALHLAAFFSTLPIPLVSISLLVVQPQQDDDSPFKRRAPTEINPLLLTCWKRQLVGCVIAHSNSLDLSSTVKVNFDMGGLGKDMSVSKYQDTSALLRVQQVARMTTNRRLHSPSSLSSPPVILYRILPSTRITILQDRDQHEISVHDPNSAVLDLSKQFQESCQTVQRQRPPTSEQLQTNNNEAKDSRLIQALVEVFQLVHHGVPTTRAMLLSGPPGTGKTHSVRTAVRRVTSSNQSPAGDLSAPRIELVSLRGSELSAGGDSQLSGESSKALKRIFEKAAHTASEDSIVVLFFDECDALLTSVEVAEMLAAMLDTMNQIPGAVAKNSTGWNRVVVIAATNRADSIPMFLRRSGRLEREIAVGPPSVDDRRQMLELLLVGTNVRVALAAADSVSTTEIGEIVDPDMPSPLSHEDIVEISELTVGFVPADLVALVRRATALACESGHGRLTIANLREAVVDVGASALRHTRLNTGRMITWDDIAGDPGGAKTALRQAIEWPRTKRAAYEKLGLVPPRGILLHGPPGCAKTTLARAAAGASSVAFLSYAPADVYSSSYVGEAESVIRRAFTLARSVSPCILFFDEIDVIFGGDDGGGRGSSAEARVLSTFLNEMDGVDAKAADGVLVLGATNRPWTLDSALLRPGRLGDKIIYVAPPDKEARRSILDMYLKSWGLSDEDLDHFADEKITGSMTGAEIVGACQEAGMALIRSLDAASTSTASYQKKRQCLDEAISSTVPILSRSEVLDEFRLFDHGVR